MSPARNATLEAARTMLGLSVATLWVEFVGVGGNLPSEDIQTFLAGEIEISDRDYDYLVQALNDRFTEEGGDHPIPYADEL